VILSAFWNLPLSRIKSWHYLHSTEPFALEHPAEPDVVETIAAHNALPLNSHERRVRRVTVPEMDLVVLPAPQPSRPVRFDVAVLGLLRTLGNLPEPLGFEREVQEALECLLGHRF
jgi:hypothetical protein